MRRAAKADLSALATEYDTKTEEAWAEESWKFMAAHFGGAREEVQEYEPFNLRLGGHWYRIDFMHILDTGAMVLVEVKSTRKHKGFQTTLIKLKEAAHKFPYWTFALAVGKKGNWEFEIIKP